MPFVIYLVVCLCLSLCINLLMYVFVLSVVHSFALESFFIYGFLSVCIPLLC